MRTKNFCSRLGERELVAHNVSKRYLENLRREAWKGRRGSVERGKTYQENIERGKTYQENFERGETYQEHREGGKTYQENRERGKTYQEKFASQRGSFQSKTKSLEKCVEREVENGENLSICVEKTLENLDERKNLERDRAVKLPPIYAQETGSIWHHDASPLPSSSISI